MTQTDETLKRFENDTKDHVLDVKLDDGVHRHMRWGRPGSSVYHVNVTTWPGHLCISGDMGCFVFARVHDMFTFHRRREGDKPGNVSLGYWAQKLQATDKPIGHEEFDEDYFAEWVDECVAAFIEAYAISGSDVDELREEIEHDILDRRHDGEHVACQALYDFRWANLFVFPEPCDWPSFKRPTHHFVWCCLAIEEVIDAYDSMEKE